jgi:Methylamine utilisation protein MauE
MDPLLELTVAWALAVLFAVSTAHKLAALAEWPGVVRNYRLLPETLTVTAAGALLIAAALTAAALMWPATHRIGACAAAAQLIVFAAAIAINLRRGRTSIDCGCFGSRLRQGLSVWMVARNLVLALLALALLLPGRSRELTALDIATALAVVATLSFLYPVLAVVLRPPPATFAENFEGGAAARRAH